ncbi:tRNA glutamyl-Q(34) synthetase GluQRS [Atopomonas sediminilitoris]|uniref:tRNA glutamyl-Q(34) synthetase GluQRS n=1 Tax=Atopomonas sediminilitoris TaxID=2919919 RepID=UPI001F4D99E9|nr:tRNA glutamyl-Q(34) synthetase GluQRS [Atopomonas sediminilitoris]MCJ8168119.1 tRNA glutamyl-Q(34) synthetase GluQRS [Atopomonas sediminilitoris]
MPNYIGRFAPTPSGFLHFGSLLAALASFLDARAAGGHWLLRMEDLDPPREVTGSAAAILHTLDAYGLHWDGPVLYQSQRHDAYQAICAQLQAQGLAYACTCSRKDLSAYHGRYPGLCRDADKPLEDAALRVRVSAQTLHFNDRIQGLCHGDPSDEGDFIIQRRDRLFAYHLAVVLDDAYQGITHVVRGADLLDSTCKHLFLQRLLKLPQPEYLHIPLILQPDGHKLGKSYRSAALPPDQVVPLLLRALRALGQSTPAALADASRDELLQWAIAHWRVTEIPASGQLYEANLH